MPSGVVARFAVDRHRLRGKYRGGVKKRSVMLAAIEAMTKADTVWTAGRDETDISTQAAAGKLVHSAPSQSVPVV